MIFRVISLHSVVCRVENNTLPYYLSPYYDDENLRANSFQEGENDENLTSLIEDKPITLLLNPMGLDTNKRQPWVTQIRRIDKESDIGPTN